MIHPPGDIGFARNADGIALILIAESAKQVIKLVIHLGNPGSVESIGSKFGAEQQTGLDRAPFAPGGPEKGILAPRRPPRLPRDWQTRVTAHHWPPRRPPCWKHRPVPPINSVRRRNPDLSGWYPIALVTRTRSCFTAFSRTFAVAPCDSSRSSRLVINWTSFGALAKPVAGAPKTPGFLRRTEFIDRTSL